MASETAAALTLAQPALPPVMAPPENAVLTEDDAKEARIEKARVYYRRRFRPRRRVVVVRRHPYRRYRRFYGPRYVYRPRYYRPRVFWGPRFYRRRYWW